MSELIVDCFAGGGGASLGIEWALGRAPDIAVNHDPEAVAMHQANHPHTRHLCGDVWDVRPEDVCGGLPVGLAWFSPDCTHHSKARGGKPHRDRKKASGRRALAWVVIRWARSKCPPRVIILENVEEFADWGPLDNDGMAIEAKRGLTYRIWLGKLRAAGYTVESRELRACDYGAPTSRKRLFIIARRDGRPIVWPKPTHGRGLLPYRTAAECIDWTLECPSIFARSKPLAENTLRRIARGLKRFVIDAAEPFIVPTTHPKDQRVHSIHEPLRTITSAHRGELALVSPTLIHSGNGEREGQAPRVYDIHKPLSTIMAEGQKHALVSAFLAKHYGGHEATGSTLSEPVHTVTARDHHALVTSHMVKLMGTCPDGQDLRAPAPTIRAQGSHLGEVRAFLTKYYGEGTGQPLQLSLGTITTRDRFGLVLVHGEAYEIADIGMRMLQPRELFTAQGFPLTYKIDVEPSTQLRLFGAIGRKLTKEAQIRMCGNSVSPYLSKVLSEANVELEQVAA